MTFVETVEAAIVAWHGMAVPSEQAHQLAIDLEASVKAFEKVRDRMRFEDEPASFIAALQATKE
jgi:hypothetical protein